MKLLTKTEKEKFAENAIISTTEGEYWVDIKERTVIDETALALHLGCCSDKIALIMAEEDARRASGVRSFTMGNIPGVIRF